MSLVAKLLIITVIASIGIEIFLFFQIVNGA